MLHCYFCRATAADVDAAIQADWIPSFYDGQREVTEPVCPSCRSTRLRYADDGEWELAGRTNTPPTPGDNQP